MGGEERDRWIETIPFYDKRDAGILTKPLDQIVVASPMSLAFLRYLEVSHLQMWDRHRNCYQRTANFNFLHNMYRVMRDKSETNVKLGFDKAAEEVLRVLGITREKPKDAKPYCDECGWVMAFEKTNLYGFPSKFVNVPVDTYVCIHPDHYQTHVKQTKGTAAEAMY